METKPVIQLWDAASDERRFGDEVLANTVDRLCESRLFTGVPRAIVERCAGAFALRAVPPRTTIVLDGTAERTVHVVRRGTVRLHLRAANGTAFVAAVLASGDAFGVETLAGVPSVRYAVCSHETLLLSAPAHALAAAFASCALLAANVAGVLAHELDGMATAVHGLACAPLCDTVEGALRRVARECGVTVADGTLLDVALGTHDVAALARVAPGDAATALFFLERDGRIRRNGPSITLLTAPERRG